jgi:hypothetical protein
MPVNVLATASCGARGLPCRVVCMLCHSVLGASWCTTWSQQADESMSACASMRVSGMMLNAGEERGREQDSSRSTVSSSRPLSLAHLVEAVKCSLVTGLWNAVCAG